MSDNHSIDPEDVYAIGAAAWLLRISSSTLRDLERRGKIACTWTPGRQRRFAGSELLRLLEQSQDAAPTERAQTPSARTTDTTDTTARRAWLGQLIARAQRELPADTPAAIRFRLATDLGRGLSTYGLASSLGDVEPLITSAVEHAKRQVQTAQEDAERREMKGELVEFGLTHLRRRVDALSTRMVGARGSLTRRHIQSTLRDQFRDRLQKQLRGDEEWSQIRELAEDFLAAWFVAQPAAPRIPPTVKLLAVGATGLVGGATAAAALSPEIQARAAKLKAPLLALAGDILKRLSTPSPPTSPAPPTAQTTTTPPPIRPGVGFGAGWPQPNRRTSRYSRWATQKSPKAAEGSVAASDRQNPDTPPANSDAAQPESPDAPSPSS
jgi:DNA-binding transcriptional MerR regulator